MARIKSELLNEKFRNNARQLLIALQVSIPLKRPLAHNGNGNSVSDYDNNAEKREKSLKYDRYGLNYFGPRVWVD